MMVKEEMLLVRHQFAYQAIHLAALPINRASLRHTLIGLPVVCEISTAGMPYHGFTALMRPPIESLLSNRYHFDTIL